MKRSYLISLLLGTGIFLGGYVVGHFDVPQRYLNLDTERILVEVQYLGGWPAEDKISSERIYTDGRIVREYENGVAAQVAKLSNEQIEDLEALIAKENEIKHAFIKKDNSFCRSAADGIDSEWFIRLTDGEIVSYSDCDYTVHDQNDFVQSVREYLSLNRYEE